MSDQPPEFRPDLQAPILADVAAPSPPLTLEAETKTGRGTARRAISILLAKGQGFHEPSALERRNLCVGFAKVGKVLYGAAFDAIRLAGEVDLGCHESIEQNVDLITVYEVKSTNRPKLDAAFSGYFFDLTTAELLVAQSLGDSYRFAFVNTITGEHLELALSEVFGKARRIYPKWAVLF